MTSISKKLIMIESVDGRILYASTTAKTKAEALEEAVAKGVDLTRANLTEANLQGAKMDKNLQETLSIDDIIEVWSKQTGFQYRPSDIACAYYIGFITQVPMNLVLYTNAKDIEKLTWGNQTALLVPCCKTAGSRMPGFNIDGTLRNKTISMLIPAIKYLISTSEVKDLTPEEYQIAVRSIVSVTESIDLKAESGCVEDSNIRKILRNIDRMLSQKFYANDLVD